MNENRPSNVVTFSTKDLCMFVKTKVCMMGGAHGTEVHKITVWFGPFLTEEIRTHWRSDFEKALEANGAIECLDIRCMVQSKRARNLSPFDIDPRISAEEAPRPLPQVLLHKIPTPS